MRNEFIRKNGSILNDLNSFNSKSFYLNDDSNERSELLQEVVVISSELLQLF